MWKVFIHFRDLKHERPHIGEKIYRSKHNELVCIHSVNHQTNEIMQSVMNMAEVTYMGLSSLFPITKKYI
jgi:hypothetical protein